MTSILVVVTVPLLLAVLTASANVGGLGLRGPDAVRSGGPIGHRFPISFEQGIAWQPAVSYSPDREEYLVAWVKDRDYNDEIRAQRVTASGMLAGDPFFVAAGPAGDRWGPHVTYDIQRGEYLVVYGLQTSSTYELHAQPVKAEGGVTGTDTTVVAVGSPIEGAVAYSPVSDKYLVVWVQSATNATEMLGQVLNSDGTKSGTPSSIRKVQWPDGIGSLDVAYNRSRNEYLVVWEEWGGDTDLYGRRVQGNGTPMQPDSITITALSGHQQWPAVAAMPTEPNKGQYLVVWREEIGGPNTGEIWARRVSGEGNTEGGYFRITDDTDDEVWVDVAASEQDHQYLVVTNRYLTAGPDKVWVLQGRKVSLDGELVGREAWIEGYIIGRLGVASGLGTDFLIAFEDETPTTSKAIYGHLWGNFRVYLPLVVR
jgi:hypothetical protein